VRALAQPLGAVATALAAGVEGLGFAGHGGIVSASFLALPIPVRDGLGAGPGAGPDRAVGPGGRLHCDARAGIAPTPPLRFSQPSTAPRLASVKTRHNWSGHKDS
jgi:hypothetical protein